MHAYFFYISTLFFTEIVKLKEAQARIQKLCIAGKSDKSGLSKKMKVYGHGTVGYILTPEGKNNTMCIIKSAPETTVVEIIRNKMNEVRKLSLTAEDRKMIMWN